MDADDLRKLSMAHQSGEAQRAEACRVLQEQFIEERREELGPAVLALVLDEVLASAARIARQGGQQELYGLWHLKGSSEWVRASSSDDGAHRFHHVRPGSRGEWIKEYETSFEQQWLYKQERLEERLGYWRLDPRDYAQRLSTLRTHPAFRAPVVEVLVAEYGSREAPGAWLIPKPEINKWVLLGGGPFGVQLEAVLRSKGFEANIDSSMSRIVLRW